MSPGSRRERQQRTASPARSLGRPHFETAHQPQTLPTGTITFLFTDVEGSTSAWERAADAMRAALARHDELIEQLVAGYGGTVVRSRGEGDSRFAVFARASGAVAAALDIQSALLQEAWPTPAPLRVRIALHSGEAQQRAGDYYGSAVNRCARLRAIAHGGQVLLSGVTAELVRDSLPESCSLRDLGQHYLKDLTAPERVWQLTHPQLPGDFPPLVSHETRGHHLPAQLSSFVGRDLQVHNLSQLLRSARLVTLTGAGGIGKTRLALEVAGMLESEFAGGAWLVELASLADPALVIQTVAGTLDVHEDPKQSPIDNLIQAVGHRRLLLLLDNCEHLIESCAELADLLLRGCPSLTILATSREPLGLDGEITWRVPSLDVPAATAAEAVAASAAAQLFVDRATAVRPGFQLSVHNATAIAKLCARLDGIPLALELAAAWVSVLSVDQIVDRLDQALHLLVTGSRRAPARQQTLRATLDWSYTLLSEPERRLFESLSVFAGGWTLGSAESVCVGAPLPREAVLDLLAQLIKKSLVMAEPASDGGVRYRLLEPVRQYARERLADSSFAEDVRHRHALRFLELAEQSESALRGPDRAIWLEQLQREHDNLRAALIWAESVGDLDLGLRLAAALAPFWALAGHIREGLRWLEAVKSAGAGQPIARAKVLAGVGLLSLLEGDLERARANLEMSLELLRELRDTSGIVEALNSLGRVTLDGGDAVSARSYFNESLILARAIGHRWGAGVALSGLSQVAVVEGDDDRARLLFEQALAVYRGLDSRPHVAATLANVASVLLAQGNDKAACDWLAEALDLVSNVNDDAGLAHTLEAIGLVAEVRGRMERAAGLRWMATMLRSRGERPLAGSDHAWPSAAEAIRHRRNAGSEGVTPSAWSFDLVLSEALAEVRTR